MAPPLSATGCRFSTPPPPRLAELAPVLPVAAPPIVQSAKATSTTTRSSVTTHTSPTDPVPGEAVRISHPAWTPSSSHSSHPHSPYHNRRKWQPPSPTPCIAQAWPPVHLPADYPIMCSTDSASTSAAACTPAPSDVPWAPPGLTLLTSTRSLAHVTGGRIQGCPIGLCLFAFMFNGSKSRSRCHRNSVGTRLKCVCLLLVFLISRTSLLPAPACARPSP